jgi:hypothetical protein
VLEIVDFAGSALLDYLLPPSWKQSVEVFRSALFFSGYFRLPPLIGVHPAGTEPEA